MSLVAIRNGVVALMSASGPWAAQQISTCSYDLLERSNSTCAVTLFPDGTTEIEPLRFGDFNVTGNRRKWRIGGTVWINADGDPQSCLSRCWQAPDDLYDTFAKDNTFGGTSNSGKLVSISQERDKFWGAGGHMWKMIDFVLVAEEF